MSGMGSALVASGAAVPSESDGTALKRLFIQQKKQCIEGCSRLSVSWGRFSHGGVGLRCGIQLHGVWWGRGTTPRPPRVLLCIPNTSRQAWRRQGRPPDILKCSSRRHWGVKALLWVRYIHKAYTVNPRPRHRLTDHCRPPDRRLLLHTVLDPITSSKANTGAADVTRAAAELLPCEPHTGRPRSRRRAKVWYWYLVYDIQCPDHVE